jgi:dihydrolipoamide dehydrogenase
MNSYDLAVLGGGPGGYVAAIRAAKLGLSVALIEGSDLGGTCLNRGCIPSKTLLHFAEVSEAITKANEWGVHTGPVTFDWKSMVGRQNKVMDQLRSGIAGLLKMSKITHIRGWGKFVQAGEIEVQTEQGNVKVTARKIILATGSKPFVPPIPGLSDVPYHTSDSIFQIESIPSSMTIIGGGVIGVEFAAMFSVFGTQVTIIEAADRIVPAEDEAASQALAKALKQRGVTIQTGTMVDQVRSDGSHILVTATMSGQQHEQSAEALLVAVGRVPNMKGLEGIRLAMNGRFVEVNKQMETSLEDVFAVGDLIGGWQLAHVASAEGLIAASNAAGHKEEINYKVIPRCIYTHPEIASVGITEQEAKSNGLSVKVQTYSLRGNAKALTMGESDGFVKLIAEEKYGEILGVTMVGPHVTDMITTSSAFMHLEGTVTEWAKLIHPHPTVSESLFEAANGWLGLGVH